MKVIDLIEKNGSLQLKIQNKLPIFGLQQNSHLKLKLHNVSTDWL